MLEFFYCGWQGRQTGLARGLGKVGRWGRKAGVGLLAI